MNSLSLACFLHSITRCHRHSLMQRDSRMVEQHLKELISRGLDPPALLKTGTDLIGRTASMTRTTSHPPNGESDSIPPAVQCLVPRGQVNNLEPATRGFRGNLLLHQQRRNNTTGV